MVSDPRVVSAMRAVDRGDFIATAPYEDSPQLIGHGVTISAPHMHASCLEMLVDYCRPNSVALDIGCGSGIFTVLMSAVAGHRATVIGIDHVSHLVDLSRTNVEKHHADHLRAPRIPGGRRWETVPAKRQDTKRAASGEKGEGGDVASERGAVSENE